MSLTPGTRLGPYEIQSPLGAGGMGEVYKARDTRLDRTVAIKVLPEHVASDPDLKKRFDREARTISSLNHPHICTLYDIGRAPPSGVGRGGPTSEAASRGAGVPASDEAGIDFLVMEYLEGETLAQRLTKGALPLDEALRYAIEIADALDKAHRQGITHRDLKPANIMVTKAGTKLLDFGLAKLKPPTAGPAGMTALPTQGAGLTMQGTILGTLQYMSPEQLEGKDADHRSDIFAFGAIVHEMVTGKKVFEGPSQASLIAAILEHDPQPMSTLRAMSPRSLDHVVTRCLAKDPDERWQAASDAMLEMKWVAKGGSEQHATSAASIARAMGSRERIAWVALALVAVLAAVSLVFDLQPGTPPPEIRLDITTPPTTYPGSLAISPDGETVVFVATFEGRAQLWLRVLDSTAAHPLAGTAGARYPFWSPDNQSVGFFADQRLKRIDLDGGLVQNLAGAPAGTGGSWNRDGVILFAPTVSGQIFRISSTGGEAVAVTGLEAQQGSHRFPQFLPDGRYFVYYAGATPETSGIYVGDLDGTLNRRLLTADAGPALYASPGQLLFVRQQTLFAQNFDPVRLEVNGNPFPVTDQVLVADFGAALSASAAGPIVYRIGSALPKQFIWFDRSGNETGRVGDPDMNSPLDASIAPDGRHLAMQRGGTSGDVWLLDIGNGLLEPFTFDPSVDAAPIWSPDGTRIVFGSNREGAYDLYEKSTTDRMSAQVLLASEEANTLPSDWSRDGRFLLYRPLTPEAGYDIWALPMNEAGESSGDPFPLVQTQFDERDGQFSPDGNWIAYQSNQSGQFEVYVQPFPGPGTGRQVSGSGGAQVRWAPDGEELFYIALDDQLMSVPIEIGSDGRTVEWGVPVPLFPTRVGGAVQGYLRQQYIVSPDGQRFLMNAYTEQYEMPISVLLNWRPGSES